MKTFACAIAAGMVLCCWSEQTLACVGDCDDNGSVSINELITGVNIALGSVSADSCSSLDLDENGMVSVSELIAAVNNALRGCADPLATPTPQTSPTGGATTVPTATATPDSGGACGDTTTVDSFFTSNAGLIRMYPVNGNGGLSEAYDDPAGYDVQLGFLLGFNQIILSPGHNTTTVVFSPEDSYEDLENEVNVILNADPAQPLIGVVGVLQCDKGNGEWFLSLAAAVDRLNNFVGLSSVQPG